MYYRQELARQLVTLFRVPNGTANPILSRELFQAILGAASPLAVQTQKLYILI